MTKSEYHELIDFLGVRFDRIERRFEALEQRVTRVEIGQESLRDDMRAIADGLLGLSDRVDRLEAEVRGRFDAQELNNVHVNVRLDSIEKRLSAA